MTLSSSYSNYAAATFQKYSTMQEIPSSNDNNHKIEELKENQEFLKSGSFNTCDAQFFQSLNDFKTDFLFNKTESILAKPPQIYRQVNILFPPKYNNNLRLCWQFNA